jgi:hypothetical protein
MATCSVTSAKTGKLALRLPPDEREAFLKKYKAKLCDAYGKVQVEYVEVPDSLLASTGELRKFFDASYVYVCEIFETKVDGAKEEIETHKTTCDLS